MRTSRAEPALFALLWLLAGGTAGAAEPRNVRVALQFESSSTNRVTGADPAGRVIVTRRGVGGRGGLTVEDSRTRVRQTTSLFVVVQDGGEGRLLVATTVPYPQVAFFYDYATARGLVATGIQWEQVGTSLVVRPSILPDGTIRVRLTPHVTYLTATGGGEVEFAEASSDLRVPAGAPVALGGAEQQLSALTRQILGERASQASGQLTLTLLATVQ
jgi:Bacterial type II and III secretion system protein